MTLRVTFLGTGGAVPTTRRNTAGVFVNREGDELLFDVGEGTQRQMMRFGTGFGVDAVFLSHVHGDHVLGLPGLVQTWGFNDRTAPLTVYTPAETTGHVRALLDALGTERPFDLTIEGVRPGEIALDQPEYQVRTVAVDHRTTAVGYALVEEERKGRFDRQRAEELGVPPGPLFSQLHEGQQVELDDGTVVEPEEVVGPTRPGRKLVYTGDTRPTETVVDAASGADLLIHDATFTESEAGRARETGHATAREAGQVAAQAKVAKLALVHVSSRYAGDPSPLRKEATEAYEGSVTVPDDGDEISVPFPDVPETAEKE